MPLALVVTGAAVLIVAEFTPLQRVLTLAAHPVLARTVTTGAHDGFALVPIAVLALALAGLAITARSRAAWLGIGLLGLAGLAIALLVDRRGIHAGGAVVVAHALRPAQVRAGVGIYAETLGAALLVVGAVAGSLL